MATRGVREEITFGAYLPNESCRAEGFLSFRTLHGELCPRLEIFDDGWQIFAAAPALATELAALGQAPGTHRKRDVVALLERCGFVDATARKAPLGA